MDGPEYRLGLSEADRAMLPGAPAAPIELTDTNLAHVAGGLEGLATYPHRTGILLETTPMEDRNSDQMLVRKLYSPLGTMVSSTSVPHFPLREPHDWVWQGSACTLLVLRCRLNRIPHRSDSRYVAHSRLAPASAPVPAVASSRPVVGLLIGLR